MYGKLLVHKMDRLRHNLYRSAREHSGVLAVVAAIIILLGIGIAVKERGRGNLHRIKTALKVTSAPASQQPAQPQPGGQDAIVLERMQMANSQMPEFLSVTLLPGRGMNMLQITAYIPDKGEVNLLASPSLANAAKLLNNETQNTNGSADLTLGGVIEAPWAGVMRGRPLADASSIAAAWQGHNLILPADLSTAASHSQPAAVGGLLMTRRSDSAKSVVMPDGGQAQSIYDAGDFNGHWFSNTVITTAVQLSGRSIEISIAARNTGKVAEPIGIGWHPLFAILSGNRAQELLKLPASAHVESRKGVPDGSLTAVAGTPFDFSARGGRRLGTLDLDDTFVHLKPGFMDSGPIAELRDPASNYGLRITALTPAIKAFHVDAPANSSFVSIDPRFNYDDPFGHEWPKGEDTGMDVLQPGQTAQWKIRLEIFSLSGVSQPL